MPLMLDDDLLETGIADVVEIADRVRKDNSGLPEFVVRRKVRDEIDRARRKLGRIGYGSVPADLEH